MIRKKQGARGIMFRTIFYLVLTLALAAAWAAFAHQIAPPEVCAAARSWSDCRLSELSVMPKLATMVFIYAIAVVFFVITARRQNRKMGKDKNGRIRRYRHAEEYLVETGKLSHEALIEYHREYRWEAYSGFALSAAIVVAALVIQGDATGTSLFVDAELALWNAGILAIAGALMAAAEIVHTNTLSPLVPIKTRLKVVGRSIVVAGIGITLAVSSVFAFIALAAPVVAIAGALVFFFLVLWLQSARAIPRDEMIEQFKLDEDEWDELVRRVDGGGKHE